MGTKEKKFFYIIVGTILSTAIITTIAILYIVPFFTKTISNWGNAEILSFITLIGVLVAFCVPFIGARYQRKLERERQESSLKSLYQIDIHVTVLENRTVLFSASIENVGDKTIITKVSNLYIDEGIKVPKGSEVNVTGKNEIGAVYYDFPFILQHKKNINNRPDCILCIKCRDEKDFNYPLDNIEDRFKNVKLYHANIQLRHLSDESIQYIYPKEKFSEDVILQFKKGGVYRVTFIVTTDGESDCECATKQFYIPE